MGVMRSSKLDEGLNFHLRMMVQPMAIAPTQDAMTMITVSAALGNEVEAPDIAAAESSPVLVGTAAGLVTVWKTRPGE